MKLYRHLILIVGIAFIAYPSPLMAAEDKDNAQTEESDKTPITEWVEAENKLAESLPLKNKETMYILRHKHAVIRTIGVVRGEINEAVKSCAKENPEISDTLKERFSDWEKSVLPLIKTAKKSLNREIEEQNAVHESDLRHILDLNDKAYEYRNAQVTKTPISDLKACQKLIISLDKTEDNLVVLLQEALLPEEVLRNRSERASKKLKKSEDKKEVAE